MPIELGLLTINLLRQSNEQINGATDSDKLQKDSKNKNTIFSYSDIVNDPLIILRCDKRVFQSPTLLHVLLQTLSCFLIASKKHLVIQAQTSPVGGSKQEELNTLLYAQYSAVIQILLEFSNSELLLSCVPGIAEEIRTLICEFLHAQFIEQPLLVKLIHYQTYDPQLLPILVEGVPSMHVCLMYIPEFLLQPERSKQLFAIRLATTLFRKYPLQSR